VLLASYLSFKLSYLELGYQDQEVNLTKGTIGENHHISKHSDRKESGLDNNRNPIMPPRGHPEPHLTTASFEAMTSRCFLSFESLLFLT